MHFIRARALVPAAITLMLASCGGNGSSDPTPHPDPSPVIVDPATPGPYNLSGTISVVETSAVDADTNDPNQADYKRNDQVAGAQSLRAPVMLVGTVNIAGQGPEGRNRSAGDVDDIFKVELAEGQVVELEFASDPKRADVDLYLVSADGKLVGASEGTDSRAECIKASVKGSYYGFVSAYSGASIYNLRIGAPGTGSACSTVTSAAQARSGELLAKPLEVPGASKAVKAALQTRVKTAGIDALAPVPQSSGLQLMRLPTTASARALGLAVLAGAVASPGKKAEGAGETASSDMPERVDMLKYAKRLMGTGQYAYVEPNWLMESTALVGNFPPNDRGYPVQKWHYEQIELPAAMARLTALPTQPAQRPIVAVIDSGVMTNHPDLAPQLASPGRAFISRTTEGDHNTASGDDTSKATDTPPPHFHGTHVAGTVGAAAFDGIGGTGVAPMALIEPLRVFDGKYSSLLDTINAMLYAARLPNSSGVLPARRADVINLSLGTIAACPAAYQEAVSSVRAAGVIVVAAAGNSADNAKGKRMDAMTPANCEGVIAVSATDARQKLTSYSHSGTRIGVAAPGGDLDQSTTGSGLPDGVFSDLATFDANGTRQPSFGPLDGTSMASPHVAGVMALMRYINPHLSVAQVDALLSSGALTQDLGAPGRDADFGWGVISARKAVEAALASIGSTVPTPEARVEATPSSLDFGAFLSSANLKLSAGGNTSERVTKIESDTAAVSVAAGSDVNATTRLGSYTVNVNRAQLPANATAYPKLTVTLSSNRTLVVPLSVSNSATPVKGQAGPIYVLLVDPDTEQIVDEVVTHAVDGSYKWSKTGFRNSKVIIVAGSDLDNDGYICARGETCGAYPLLGSGLSVLELSGHRSDLNFQASPQGGGAVQASVGAGDAVPGAGRWGRLSGQRGARP